MEEAGMERRPADQIETGLFRIAQEALTNIAKHAQATSAEVSLLVEPRQVRLDVSDDGCGMDEETVKRAALYVEAGADGIFVPLAKWSMLLAGNYRCLTDNGVRSTTTYGYDGQNNINKVWWCIVQAGHYNKTPAVVVICITPKVSKLWLALLLI